MFFCGPSVVFTNVMNPKSRLDRKKEYKETIVKYGSSLGANVTALCGITIGRYSFIGAGSVLTQNTKPYGLYIGMPAIHSGWISREGFKLSLPLRGNSKTVCKKTEEEYHLRDGTCYHNSENYI